MRIVQLSAENVKRLRAVDITPDEHVQIVGGRNAQGKTSVLDAIWLALGGGAASRGTSQPVRDGEAGARVRLDLGDLTVTRTWDATGRSTLRVETAEGTRHTSPQAVLDSLVGRLSFDPLEFTRLAAREQVAALLRLVELPIDLDAMAAERQRLYDARTELGREGKQLAGQLAGLGAYETAPAEEVLTSTLLAELRDVQEVDRRQRDEVRRYTELREEQQRLQARLAEVTEQTMAAGELVHRHQPVDVGAAEDRLGAVSETNATVRRNRERASVEAGVADARAAYAELGRTIDGLDRERSDALAAADFPVDGLGFGDSAVTFRGIPFSQASAAEQIRVSMAMAMALNPALRVIRVLDGSLLDADSLAMIAEMARERDYQVWIERVGDGDPSAVVIEDGRVLSTEPPPLCPSGCGCRWLEDADRHDCACDGICCTDEWDLLADGSPRPDRGPL